MLKHYKNKMDKFKEIMDFIILNISQLKLVSLIAIMETAAK